MMALHELDMGRVIYAERLRKAEQAYRFRHMAPKSGTVMASLRTFLGNLLIGSGKRLKGTGRITFVGT